MLKIVLKYCICEMCIDIFFKTIEKNFSNITYKKEKLFKMYYNSMTKYYHKYGAPMVTYEYFKKINHDISIQELYNEIVVLLTIYKC